MRFKVFQVSRYTVRMKYWIPRYVFCSDKIITGSSLFAFNQNNPELNVMHNNLEQQYFVSLLWILLRQFKPQNGYHI